MSLVFNLYAGVRKGYPVSFNVIAREDGTFWLDARMQAGTLEL